MTDTASAREIIDLIADKISWFSGYSDCDEPARNIIAALVAAGLEIRPIAPAEGKDVGEKIEAAIEQLQNLAMSRASQTSKGVKNWQAMPEWKVAGLLNELQSERSSLIEQCAKIAETRHKRWKLPHPDDAKPGEVCDDVSACRDIAAAIRALKVQP